MLRVNSTEADDAVRAELDISFVITVYNKSAFIRGMIDSLRRQRCVLRAEYIFIDDGSTDDSRDQIAELAIDLPNVVVVNQVNMGPAIATNVGVQRARGRYVKLLDADDRLVPGITELLCQELERTGADLIVGELDTYNLESMPADRTARLEHVDLLDDPLQTIIMRGLSNTSGCMFRRAVFQAVGGCDESVFVQDFSFFLRIAHRGRILVTRSVVASVPEVADGRVSGMIGQTLHDANRALYNLIMTNPDIPTRYQCMAMRRAAGRAWRWARRRRGAGLLSKRFVVHLISRLPFAALALWVLRDSCRAFYVDSNLRFPGSRV
jgi:glycosyltransferase involved in cell wall biosynthesis